MLVSLQPYSAMTNIRVVMTQSTSKYRCKFIRLSTGEVSTSIVRYHSRGTTDVTDGQSFQVKSSDLYRDPWMTLVTTFVLPELSTVIAVVALSDISILKSSCFAQKHEKKIE